MALTTTEKVVVLVGLAAGGYLAYKYFTNPANATPGATAVPSGGGQITATSQPNPADVAVVTAWMGTLILPIKKTH